jgi:hypothetical protein
MPMWSFEASSFPFGDFLDFVFHKSKSIQHNSVGGRINIMIFIPRCKVTAAIVSEPPEMGYNLWQDNFMEDGSEYAPGRIS